MAIVKQLIDRIRAQLSDAGVDAERWSDRELIDYINDGLRETVRIKPEANIIEYLFFPIDEAPLQKLPEDCVKFIKCSGNRKRGQPIIDGDFDADDEFLHYGLGEPDAVDVDGILIAGELDPLLADLTSRIYPVEDIETMAVAGVVQDGRLRLTPYNIDLLTVGGSLQAGELRGLLKDYAWPPEAIDVTGALQDGELRTLLRTYVWPPENIMVTGALTEGTLRVALVQYLNWPTIAQNEESLGVNGSLLSGSLV